MSNLWIHLAVPLASLLVGWVALWPARRYLGPAGYHCTAYPTGLISWSLAAALSTLNPGGFATWVPLAGAVLYIALLWLGALATGIPVFRRTNGRGPSGIPLWTYAAMGSGFVAMGAVLAAARLTAQSGDSWMTFWPLGLKLARDGAVTITMVSERGVSIPAMNAVHVSLGGDWLYVAYPLLAVNLVMLLLLALARSSADLPRRRVRTLVRGGMVLFLLTTPFFVSNAFYVHSHLFSAVYLLIALIGTSPFTTREQEAGLELRAWLIVGGAAVAGLILTRPDGLAYAFIPVACAIATLTRNTDGAGIRADSAFFGPLLITVLAVYGAALEHLGLWRSSKLSGTQTAALLGLLCVAATAPAAIRRLSALAHRTPAGESVVMWATAVTLAAAGAVAALRWDTFRTAALNAATNLFVAGAWWHLWYVVVAFLLLSLATAGLLRQTPLARRLLLVVVMYFALAAAIHGIGHPGRVDPQDSFNRVAFHILPVILWYAGSVLERLLAQRPPIRTAR